MTGKLPFSIRQMKGCDYMLSLKEKLDLWVKITGINPSEEKRSYTISFGGISEWDIKEMNDRIQESLSYDETGLFAEAYLKVYFKKFLQKKTTDLYSLITDKQMKPLLQDMSKLYQSLMESDAEKLIMDEAKKAMDYYNLPYDELSIFDVIELRTSAMNCINKKLHTIQLSSGPTNNEFLLSRDICMYRNIDALVLCAAQGKINGVSLAYICDDKQTTDSFFTFVIKNGGNLYLLSDMPTYAHPVQKGMSRCPGRDMSERINANFFPYETVANLDISDLWGSGRYGISSEMEISIPDDKPFVVIGTMDSMAQDEAFWMVMMASLIKDKFYTNEPPKLPISYVRSMISTPMIEQTETSLIVQKSLPSMHLEEVSIDETKGLKYGNKRDEDEEASPYEYLIDRYKEQVDLSLLNIVTNTEKETFCIENHSIKDTFGHTVGQNYSALDLSLPATEEDIVYKQKWLVRYNFAKQIKEIAKTDYKEHHTEITAWVRERIQERLADIFIMHMKGQLTGLKIERKNFEEQYVENTKVPISDLYSYDEWYDSNSRTNLMFQWEKAYNKADIRCALTGEKAGVVLTANPRNAAELAKICGCRIEDLPEQIRYYEQKDNYYGNPILDNIDPIKWIVKDPFNEMRFSLAIVLSKTMYAELCRKAGVEPVKFWLTQMPICYNELPDGSKKCKGKYKRERGFGSHLCKKCTTCKYWKEKG